jgi:hypothetical protein
MDELQLRYLPEMLKGAFLRLAARVPNEFKIRFLPSMTIGKTKGFRRRKNCAVRILISALDPGLAACAHPGEKVQIPKAESRNKNNRTVL